MAASDWEEIKRLAADFQRAQLTTTLQRLSERNCIEIINRLIDEKILDIYFTSNGKEYITPQQLSKEIKDELHVHRGRIELTELSSILNIELNIIEKRAHQIAAHNTQIHLVLGQLVHEDFLEVLTEEVNEKLQQNGSIRIGDLAKNYDLPSEFLLKVIVKHLGKTIQGQQDEADPYSIFTESFVASHNHQIRGALVAITRPTMISSIISRFHFQERLFFSIAEAFIASGEVKGFISGLKTASQAVYIPNIYSKAQFDWVQNFFKQNNYLEFESLRRLEISDPESYVRKHLQDQNLTFVPGACVGQLFIDQIDANLDDALANGGYVDLLPFLPSTFSGSVCSNLIDLALQTREKNAKAAGCSTASSNCQVFCESIVVSERLLTLISLNMEKLMPSKAQEAIRMGAFKHQLLNTKAKVDSDSSLKNRKDERRKKATGGKAGGGTQGRETKTRSTKNKHKGKRGAQLSDEDDEECEGGNKGNKTFAVEFLSSDEMLAEIAKEPSLEDAPEELLEEIVNYLHEPLSQKFQEVARNAFMASMSGGGDTRKKAHQNLQEKISALLATIRLAEKGMKEFGSDTQSQLCKYLLRTHCSEILNEIVSYLANDAQIDFKSDKELSPEVRLKIINQLNDTDAKGSLTAMNKSLTGGSLEQFLNSVDNVLASVDMILKKKDNKKDKQLLLNHRSSLVDQLNVSLTAALTLHLSCLILFQAVTGQLLQASGKFVPQILAYLNPHLPSDFYSLLIEYQGLVMKSLTSKDDDNGSSINSRLEALTPKIKELTISFKKTPKDRGNSLSED